MYKCGWNGCEKAYGTLNHLNAHVTMQSHGQKRIPEGMLPCEFILTPVLDTRWSMWLRCTTNPPLPLQTVRSTVAIDSLKPDLRSSGPWSRCARGGHLC